MAAELLKEQGKDVAVVNLHTIKPLDRELVARYAQKCKNVFTAEEHSVIGGLGDAVADVLVGNGEYTFTKIGVEDQFGQEPARPWTCCGPTTCVRIRSPLVSLRKSDFSKKKETGRLQKGLPGFWFEANKSAPKHQRFGGEKRRYPCEREQYARCISRI